MKWSKEELGLMEEFVKEYGIIKECDVGKYKVMEIFPGRNWESIRSKIYYMDKRINRRNKIKKLINEKYNNTPDTSLTKEQLKHKEVSFDIVKMINLYVNHCISNYIEGIDHKPCANCRMKDEEISVLNGKLSEMGKVRAALELYKGR